ncbi:MAG: rod shape-determining protein MreC [Planctomycetota bacterium]
MVRSWTSGRRPLVIAVLLLLIASQLPSGLSSRLAYVPREVVRFVLIPGEGTLRMLALAIRPGTSRRPALPQSIEAYLAELAATDQRAADAAYDNYLDLRVENQRLRNRVEALEDEIRQLNLVQDSLAGRPLRYLNARVTAHTASPTRRTLTLDRGAVAGVEAGQAVVSGASLVGVVVSTTGRTAEVKLINAPGETLLARLAPPDAAAPRELVEQLRVTDDGTAFTAEVPVGAPVRQGDLAHLVDRLGTWPATASGRVVGVVTTLDDRTDQPVQLQRVVVRPMLDFANLARVTVVMEVEE